MDAILTGDATKQDYARAASAAILIPMHGQQDRLHGADLSFVQTAIDASLGQAAAYRRVNMYELGHCQSPYVTSKQYIRYTSKYVARTWHGPGTDLAPTWHRPGTDLARPGTDMALSWHRPGTTWH